MKAIVKIVLMVLFLLNAGISAKAQDVDGISLWDKCTKEQLIEKYGQLEWYHSQMDDDNTYLIQDMRFKEVSIRLEANRVVEFGLHGNKPKAMTKLTKGGIGLGDSEEVLEKLKDIDFDKEELEDGITKYMYFYGVDASLNIGVKDGHIVFIFGHLVTT